MHNTLGIKLHNYFDLVLTDSKTGEVKQQVHAENVVTNVGYLRMAQLNNSGRYAFYNIAVGTGTGVPSATDTNLFNYLIYKDSTNTLTTIDETQSKRTLVAEFTENEANGVLTEVAVGYFARYSSGSVYEAHSHAMFTDSEGNPITITKTNADRLTITATVFLTVTYNNTNDAVLYKSARTRSQIDRYPTSPDRVGNESMGYLVDALWNYYSSLSIHLDLNTFPTLTASSYSTSVDDTFTSSTYTNRYVTSSRILGESENKHFTYEIRNIHVAPYSSSVWPIVAWYLPNHNIYPPKLLEINLSCDGTTQDFNTGIPHLMPSNVEVYLDSVLLSSTDYVFNGTDFNNPQGWDSYDTKYISRTINFDANDRAGWNSYCRSALPFYTYRCPDVSSCDVIYDFKRDYTVSAVGNYITSSFTFSGLPTLWYSDDDENWTQANIPVWTSETTYRNNQRVTLSNPITARYWKVSSPPIYIYSSQADYNEMVANILFGDPKPQLHLNTIPPEGSTITIKAYCEYPIKNSNWIIENGMTVDITCAPT